MATARKQLGQAKFNVAAAGVTVYTVPADTIATIKSIDVANLTNQSRDVRVHLVPNGQAAGIANALVYDIEVPANGILSWTGAQILDTAGDFIFAQAGGNDYFCITVSGVEET